MHLTCYATCRSRSCWVWVMGTVPGVGAGAQRASTVPLARGVMVQPRCCPFPRLCEAVMASQTPVTLFMRMQEDSSIACTMAVCQPGAQVIRLRSDPRVSHGLHEPPELPESRPGFRATALLRPEHAQYVLKATPAV